MPILTIKLEHGRSGRVFDRPLEVGVALDIAEEDFALTPEQICKTYLWPVISRLQNELKAHLE